MFKQKKNPIWEGFFRFKKNRTFSPPKKPQEFLKGTLDFFPNFGKGIFYRHNEMRVFYFFFFLSFGGGPFSGPTKRGTWFWGGGFLPTGGGGGSLKFFFLLGDKIGGGLGGFSLTFRFKKKILRGGTEFLFLIFFSG